jgi:hypothetical protein
MEKSLTVDLLIEKVGKNSRDGKCIVRAILRAGLEKKDADLLIQAYPYIDPRAMIKGVRKGKMRVLRDQVGKKIWLVLLILLLLKRFMKTNTKNQKYYLLHSITHNI